MKQYPLQIFFFFKFKFKLIKYYQHFKIYYDTTSYLNSIFKYKYYFLNFNLIFENDNL